MNSNGVYKNNAFDLVTDMFIAGKACAEISRATGISIRALIPYRDKYLWLKRNWRFADAKPAYFRKFWWE